MNAVIFYHPARFAAAAPVPNRRHFALVTLLLILVVIYGSIVPLHLHRQSFADALERFRTVLAEPIALKSRSDWLANFLLQLPLGFFLMASICCDRPYFAAPALLVTVVSCIALAGFVEFAQLYFPPRVSSINDIAAQTIGGTAGALGWVLAGQRLTDLTRRLWSDIGSRSTAVPLLGVYLFIVLIVQTLPFDFTLSPVEIYHKYKEGRVYLRPFTTAGASGFELVNKHFWNVVLFAPVGVLAAFLPEWISRSGRRVFLLGVLAAAAIEFAQLLAFSRYFDATDILTGSFSVLIAWSVGRNIQTDSSRRDEKTHLQGLLLLGCLAALVYMEWQPFDFSLSLSEARYRLHRVSLLPFLDYLGGNYINALDDVLHKILLYAPLGALLAPAVPASKATVLFRWSLAVAVAVVIETGQLFLPTRYSSISDVIVAGLASALTMFFVLRARALAPLSQRSVCEFSR
jgi:glycopeptide antibiotics resistance protein